MRPNPENLENEKLHPALEQLVTLVSASHLMSLRSHRLLDLTATLNVREGKHPDAERRELVLLREDLAKKMEILTFNAGPGIIGQLEKQGMEFKEGCKYGFLVTERAEPLLEAVEELAESEQQPIHAFGPLQVFELSDYPDVILMVGLTDVMGNRRMFFEFTTRKDFDESSAIADVISKKMNGKAEKEQDDATGNV